MYEYGGSGDSTILVPGFNVKRRIGVGGFATVYEAVQEDVQAPVALKVLAVDHTDERVRARFERECRTMGRLRDQRGIVAVYQSAFTSDGRPVIVMAYMPGGSLLDRLRQAGTLSVEEVTTIGVTLSRALQAAHDQGIYHRDIKPENILIDRDGQVALADFGLATVDDLLTSTRTDASLTPPHAPPERFLATENANLGAGDIYSLASTLHQLLTGRPPFGTSSDGGLAALINRVIADPPPTINRPDMTAGLTNAILLGLSKNPDDRPVSPAMFGELLAPGMIAQASTDPGLLPLPTDRVPTNTPTPASPSTFTPTPTPTSMPTRVPEATPTSMPTRVVLPAPTEATPRQGSPLRKILVGVAAVVILVSAVKILGGQDNSDRPVATTDLGLVVTAEPPGNITFKWLGDVNTPNPIYLWSCYGGESKCVPKDPATDPRIEFGEITTWGPDRKYSASGPVPNSTWNSGKWYFRLYEVLGNVGNRQISSTYGVSVP